ncbi:MAG: SUMF1/EgtB/PvdO family nonheme iron enzyme [Magnetococcales bacterium]|nr:SUMF1/EgtB/PvdO family nonheme iron enzyme [Magnetococcales bacterium]MBF0155035.1 SUMF1/EgtB/PvdO family nonheme iron enzyme [Magnetococcales bacterium]
MLLRRYFIGFTLLLGVTGTLTIPGIAAPPLVNPDLKQILSIYVESQYVGCCVASWVYEEARITRLHEAGFKSARRIHVRNKVENHSCSEVIALGPFPTWEVIDKIVLTLRKKSPWKEYNPRRGDIMSQQEWQESQIIFGKRLECIPVPKPEPETEPDPQLFIHFDPTLIQATDKDGDKREIKISNPYWLGRTETTVVQYAACVSAGVCQPPAEIGLGCHWPGYQERPRGGSYPINCLTLMQIQTFMEWYSAQYPGLHFHLPTPEQWLGAALGKKYMEDKDKNEICQDKKSHPNLCDSCPPPPRVPGKNNGWAAGASVDRDSKCLTNGLVDMVGNVAELVQGSDNSLKLMGGGWRTPIIHKLSLATLEMLEKPLSENEKLPLHKISWAGFRMAVDRIQRSK